MCDSYETCQESKGRGLLQLVKRKNFCPGVVCCLGPCCIAIATLEPVNGDSWYHMCAFRFHFWGRKVNWNQASHVRASSVPNLHAFCLNKRSCIFVRTGRPLLLILRFCGLIFGTARRSQKWDRENAFSAMFWCQQKLCGLWRPERQLGRPFWAKPVLRRFSGPRIGSVGASCFCRWFCSLLGQAGCISVAAWTRWKLASYYVVSSGGLIVCC